MLSKIITFQNCASAVEDIANPETSEVEGRAFIIIDQDDGTVYRFPMPLEVAETQGDRLKGTKVQVATPAQAEEAAKKAAVTQNLQRRPHR